MQNTYRYIFKFIKTTLLILLILLLIIGTVIFFLELDEEPPWHPLDFQDINDIVLEKPIYSVEDGLPYAINRAHEWREDAILTRLLIISVGKDEINSNTGGFDYTFEFPYIDKIKPSGIMSVFINTDLNGITLVDTSHDGEGETRVIHELKSDDLQGDINRVYDAAINAIGEDNIFQYEEPFVRVWIDSDSARFEVSSSREEANQIKYSVKIDMSTYEVLEKKEYD